MSEVELMTVSDDTETRVRLSKNGVFIKEIEKTWLGKHGIRVVYWNMLRTDLFGDKNDD